MVRSPRSKVSSPHRCAESSRVMSKGVASLIQVAWPVSLGGGDGRLTTSRIKPVTGMIAQLHISMPTNPRDPSPMTLSSNASAVAISPVITTGPSSSVSSARRHHPGFAASATIANNK